MERSKLHLHRERSDHKYLIKAPANRNRMKRSIFILSFLFLGISSAFAAHIKGGFFTYRYVGPGTNDPNASRYQVTLTVYLRCNLSPGQLDGSLNFSVYESNTNVFQFDVSVDLDQNYTLVKSQDDECISGNQQKCYYEIAIYDEEIELPSNPNGYTISYQRCCRLAGVQNVDNSSNHGNTWSINIPGTLINSSPRFFINDTAVVCAGEAFNLQFLATDPNGDSLSYEFCDAWTYQGAASPGTAAPPPYQSLPYSFGYSGTQPLGPDVGIDRVTGLISGTFPPNQGEYVVTVCVTEWRNGLRIGSTRKELHIEAGDCQPITPQLDPSYLTCDGFSLSFQNFNPNPQIQTYFWDFGVTTATNDTSNLSAPTWTYADTGVYVVKLVVNRGLGCSDSTTTLARVYPGFFPGFIFSGVCINRPTQFTDTSNTIYGVIDSWRWDFGVVTRTDDTSRLQNPQWTYTQMGDYTVNLIVSNSKGCIDTIPKTITIIDKPPLSLAFKDTLICNLDNVQLQAVGNGNFTWTPGNNITNANTATPTVQPPSTQYYYVTLNDNGCLNNDSVRVRVTNTVNLTARGDTIICEGDSAPLLATTDGFTYTWNPASGLNNPNSLNPIATPAATTDYVITANIGSCTNSETVRVEVAPYPVANAGPDVEICFNDSTLLNGNVSGSSFTWSPSSSLTGATTLNPMASPLNTTTYILSTTGNTGCPKPATDEVIVTVRPPMNANIVGAPDTLIALSQVLQLEATGGTTYLWTPSNYLSATDIANPIATFDPSVDSIIYRVHVSDDIGCIDSADIKVVIFKSTPDFYVPTGFTPNGDGRNDIIRPIGVGIKKLNYFNVYNRWGQLVYSTRVSGQGWDGRIGGKDQNSGVFVWTVSGVDILDRTITKKGTVTLIR